MEKQQKPAKRLDRIGTLLTAAGHLTVSGGVWMLRPAAGVICLGLGGLLLGLLLCRAAGRAAS